ncbi:RluA family pseudouridine synthase, partial [Candidatus Acetothermia bacterium]|nr:RluA family pseudouridine synthase [Candidatus Acetothermia bacterium]
VLVNGSAARASRLLEPGDSVVIEIPDPVSETVAPEAIPLEILFEDNSIIAVNKPSGMVVYPAAGHNSGTLINGLLAHCSLAHIGAPRIAEDEGLIDAPLGRDPNDYQRMKVTKVGKPAVTEFRVLKKFKQQTLVEAYPKTGRTHQIRVHFQAIGHPVMGDEKYGREPVIKTRLYLHAWELKLWHPSTGQRLQLTAPLPLEFASLLDAGTAASHSASNRPPTHTREKSPHK